MESDTSAATEGPGVLPGPRPNGLFAGPIDAPDRFELLGDGRRGGEGTTWRASYHGELRSAVPLAVKALHPPDGADDDWPSADVLQRWKDRTVLLQHLHLPRLVWLNEVFVGAPPHPEGRESDGPPVPYLVMEWLEGLTLAELAGGEPAGAATVGQRMQYVHEAAEALQQLHAASRSAGNPSLHRDVKPGNCIVHPARGVVLIDVGGIRTAADGYDPAGMHTPAYTAPEILRNPYRAREDSGDWYALGALAVFCLLGADPPPAGAALPDLLAPRIRAVARTAGVTDPDALAAHVLAMLRSDPASRPADGLEWAAELRRLAVTGRAVPTARPRNRRWPTLAAASALALAGLGGGVAVAAPWISAEPGTTVADPIVSSGATVSPAPTVMPSTASVAAPSHSPGVGGTVASGPPTASKRVIAPPTVEQPTPSAGATTPEAGATSTAAVVTTTGKIITPAAGSGVQKCAFVTGTARLAAGETLVLAVRNLDNDEPNEWYVQYPHGWDDPSALSSWEGVEYFPGAVGQHYEIGLFAVGLDAAKTAHAAGDRPSDALADTGAKLATRKVVQVAGGSGSDCD